MSPEQVEQVIKLWSIRKALRFQYEHLKTADRFTYHVKEQGQGLVGLSSAKVVEFLQQQTLIELTSVEDKLIRLGVNL